MFNDIPKPILDRMKDLEEIDTRDREDGTPNLERLRQIPPETGKFLAIMAAGVPEGSLLEIGTSAGYSALWLSLACKLRGEKLLTFELLPDKVSIAKKTFKKAKVAAFVELIHGDARGHMSDYDEIAFFFLDAEKEMYAEFYDMVVPSLVSGGFLVADNVISHEQHLQPLVDKAEKDERVDSIVVPLGKGLLVCRKI
ncbi:MAG: O-methyltransferase [Chloroflexi bacterium]|nr:O-methyltransferase [Chloroflexota bacterium]